MNQNSLTFTADRVYVGRTTLENCLAVSPKSKHTPSHGPAMPLPGRHLAEMHTDGHQNSHPRMFVAVLFIVTPARTTKRPSAKEWINKVWDIHIVEFYSMRTNKLYIRLQAAAGMKLSNPKLIKRIRYKSLYCMTLFK